MKTLHAKVVILFLFCAFCFCNQLRSQSLDYGDCILDSLESLNDTDTFTVVVAAGDIFIVRASSPDPAVELCLEVLDASNLPVANICDATEAVIEVSALNGGTFSIVVSESQGDATGAYHLAVQRGFFPPGIVQLECDSTITDTVACETDMIGYVISVAPNTEVLLTAVALDTFFDVCMELRDSAGNVIAQNCGGLQAQIDTTLANGGCYTILIHEGSGDTTGSFIIALTTLSGSCTNSCVFPPEICDNLIDDDGDGLVDCADTLDCQPNIVAAVPIDPSCPFPLDDGQIFVFALGQNLEFSIDGGATFQTDSLFTGLTAGIYNVRVQNSATGCFSDFAGNPLVLIDPVCPEICDNNIDDDGDSLTDCDDPDCNNTVACPPPVTFDAGEVVGLQGDTLLVPVFLLDCDSMAVVQGTFAFSNSGVVQVIGVVPGLIDPAFNLANNGFSFFDAGGTGIPVSNTDTLFFIQVVLIGNPGDTTPVVFVNSPVALQVVCIIDGTPVLSPILLSEGEVSILAIFNLNGQVRTPGGVGIGQFVVTAQGTSPVGTFTLTDITDPNGNYAIDSIVGSSTLTITPAKDINDGNGLSSFQLFLLQQFILGIPNTFITDAYDVVAGNANCDASLSTFDLLLIQRVIVVLDSVFAGCNSWVAAPATYAFPAPPTVSNPFPYPNSASFTNVVSDLTADFIGVKIGDPLETADPQNFNPPGGGGLDDRSTGTLVWSVENSKASSGEAAELPFRAKQFKDMASFQFEVTYDADKIEFESIVPYETTLFANVVAGKPEKGRLRIAWFSLSGKGVKMEADRLLFSLRFKAKERVEDFSSLLSVSSEKFITEARTAQAEKWDVALEFVTPSNPVPPSGYRLYQNVPNPAGQFTLIAFDLPDDGHAMLTVANELGQTVARFEGMFDKGRNEVEVSTERWPPGIFFYTLRAGDFTQTKRMVLNKN